MQFIEKVADRLGFRRRGTPLSEIDGALRKLKYFETDLSNPEVDRAVSMARGIIDPHFKWFQDKGVLLTYHGSLQYHDPRNLDVDIIFFSENLRYADIEEKMLTLEREFIQPGAWPRTPCDTNFGQYSMQDMKRALDEVAQEEHFVDDPYNTTALRASYILSSALLYESQRPLMRKFQGQVRRMISDNKWGREGVLFILDETIQIREERRRLLREGR